jgi:hypothetical protein
MTCNTTLLWALVVNIKYSILKYRPTQLSHNPVGLLGIEPSLRAPEARVLPVYYSPNIIYPIKNKLFRYLYLKKNIVAGVVSGHIRIRLGSDCFFELPFRGGSFCQIFCMYSWFADPHRTTSSGSFDTATIATPNRPFHFRTPPFYRAALCGTDGRVIPP